MPTPFHSRAEVGLRAPRARSQNIDALHLTTHWAGPSPWRNGQMDHARCASIWRGFQAFHMDGRRWADIAYTSGVCPHGHRYEGRGLNTRTAANGTNTGNYRSYATCYIAGVGDPLTPEAKEAFRDEADRLGKPVDKVHSDWRATSCPGNDLRAWVSSGSPRPIAYVPSQPSPQPVPPPNIDWAAVRRMAAKQVADSLSEQRTITNNSHWMQIVLVQTALNLISNRGLVVDGKWGANTDQAVKDFQRFMGLKVDGIVGDATRFWLIVGLHNIWRG